MKRIIQYIMLLLLIFAISGCQVPGAKQEEEKYEEVTDNIDEYRGHYLNSTAFSMEEMPYTSIEDVEEESDLIIIGEKQEELDQYIVDDNWLMKDNGKDGLQQRTCLDGYTVSSIKIEKIIETEEAVKEGDIITVKEGSCYDDRRNVIELEEVYKKMKEKTQYALLLRKIDKTDYLTVSEKADYAIVGGIFGKISFEEEIESEDIVAMFENVKEPYVNIMKEGKEKYEKLQKDN